MGQADRRAGVFYAKAGRWKAELEALRAILLASPLEETFKWRQPCYTWGKRNIVMPAGYAERCVLSFLRGVLLDDPEGLLVPPGENSRSARVMEFQSVEEVEARQSVIEGFIAAAIRAEEAGVKVDLPKDDFDYPEELVEALQADEALNAAWQALTPGRKRGWVLHIAGAKQATTRHSRVEKATPKILDGMGMHDR